MKKILLISTGGTIASKETAEGLQPMMTSDEILGCVPGIAQFCQVSTVQLMNLDSTNVKPSHWIRMAACVREHYDSFDGFVITHGTDTMAYTSSALSYLIQDSPKPVVLTGSQKSIATENTDARLNLSDAFRYAADDASQGVCLVFDGKVITGTRARKMRTKSFNAFSSIDFPELAVIRDGKILRYLKEPKPLAPRFYDCLSDRVFALKMIPGIRAGIFSYLREWCDVLVIEGFGVGGVPSYKNQEFLQAIEGWREAGKTVVMTTQVPHEGSDMAVYQVGYRVKEDYEVIEAYNMTLEAVVTKLMWILGQTKDPDQIRSLFYQPVAHDLLLFE